MCMRRSCAPIYQFGAYMVLFLFSAHPTQKVGKEEEFQDTEHEEEFQQNNQPKGSSDSHAAKSVSIEFVYVNKVFYHLLFFDLMLYRRLKVGICLNMASESGGYFRRRKILREKFCIFRT